MRGEGLLLALDLRREIGGTIVAKALENGLLLNTPRPDSLRFMPALTVSKPEIMEMIRILDSVLETERDT